VAVEARPPNTGTRRPLESGSLARRVTNMKNFHNVLVFAELVVHEDGAVRQLPHSRSLANDAAHAGKTRQQSNVVQQRTAKARGSFPIVFGNMADEFSEIR